MPRGGSGNIAMIRHLKKGGFFALLVDQKYNSGEPLDFLGQDAKTTTAPAENHTRAPTMATLDFTTKPLALDTFRSS